MQEPFLDTDDLAEVIATVFGGDQYIGRTLDIAGPRWLTFGAAVAELASHDWNDQLSAGERPEFAAMLLEIGMPHDEATNMVKGFAEILDGRNACITDEIDHILGRKPRDVATIPIAMQLSHRAQLGAEVE